MKQKCPHCKTTRKPLVHYPINKRYSFAICHECGCEWTWRHQLDVLILCESSGAMRRAFQKLGHNAISVDLLPADDGETVKHFQGDIFDFWNDFGGVYQWDLIIAHPPCTYLTSSGLHWNKRVEGRAAKTEEALELVRKIMELPVPHMAIENPIGRIGTAIRKADQIIQPYQFGHDASKATCLWLKNLPKLQHTAYVEPRIVNGKKRWSNQTDSGQNKLAPSADRWKLRSATFDGIAKAAAEQWANYILNGEG